jgi:DNA/RNA endonuclease G (NUC1)
MFVVSVYIILYSMSINETVEFTNYKVVYDSFFGRPVSSTQYKSVQRVDIKYIDNKISRIKQSDFKKLDKEYERGLLSPQRSLDQESGSILNIIPQLICHNKGIWSQFEGFVDKNYLKKGKSVTTVAKYGFLFWPNYFEVPNEKLYIPSQLCKILDGVEYCMKHDTSVCGKKWCEEITLPSPFKC